MLSRVSASILGEVRQRATQMIIDETYPSAQVSHLVKRVQNHDTSDVTRDWTGNDESARNQHAKVSLRESPLRLRLSWKKSRKHTAHLVGVFDLDLPRLLRAGYIRLDGKSTDEVRVRFYHGSNNVIYVQVNLKSPALQIGRIP